MNRETKIGLLVGLAFIIVIGVLLSDHIQTSTQTRPALLGASGEVVRMGTAGPGTEHPGAAKIVPPSQVEPTGQVATNETLDILAQAPQEIQIGPAGGFSGLASATGAAGGQVAVGPAIGEGVVLTGGMERTAPLMGANLQTPVPGEMTRMDALPGPVAALPSGLTTGTAEQQKTAILPPRSHTAVAGDSVYKMVVKFYGKYSTAGEAAILAANPSMGKNKSVVAGKKYVIPNLPGLPAVTETVVAEVAPKAAAAPATPAVKETPAAHVRPTVAQAEKAPAKMAAKTGGSYTVKSGDSLARIASKAGVSVAQLKAANKDLLKGSETLQIGMTLRLPEKQVASANLASRKP